MSVLNTQYSVNKVIVNVLLSIATLFIAWFFYNNRFFVLHYQEQIQLFRFDWFYFRSYLIQPGGITQYLGSFFTQFYFYPVSGACIIALVIMAVCLLYAFVCNRSGPVKQLLFVPFIPAVLLLVSFVSIHFRMSYALGLILVLAAFRCYIALQPVTRYIAGLTLFFIVYLTAGGNALILAALMLVSELFEEKQKYKYPYLLLLVICAALVPWLAWRILYTVPLYEAYFALTPGNFMFPTITNKALWLLLPALYFFWRCVAKKVSSRTFVSWKVCMTNSILVVVMLGTGAYVAYDKKGELLSRMTYEVQRENWKEVINLSRVYPTKNRLVCYYTNIALAESGQMPYRMFHFRQVGTAGLFLDWQLTYFTLWNQGEVYYRLGMIPEAEHCAFEALVSGPKEPGAQTLRRLATTNLIRRDSIAAGKYLKHFEHSFAYRKWARNQRQFLTSAMSDSAFRIPHTPAPAQYPDFFINYQYPDYSLYTLLKANPRHRMAFEYLMAYYMLQKDIVQAIQCMDTFYHNFTYPSLPVHYEEVLIVYVNATQTNNNDYLSKYPVSNATREHFKKYVQAYKVAQSSHSSFEQLEKQFGNTYWFYMHFIEPATLQKQHEKDRY